METSQQVSTNYTTDVFKNSDSSMELRLAKISDTSEILSYLSSQWQSDHVYVRHPELFLYDFAVGDNLNFGVLTMNGSIEGIFGYFYYNTSQSPDIGGMLWHTSNAAQKKSPLAGLLLRNYVLDNVPHRFFGSPGAGIQTKPIYQNIGKVWIEMDHYVGRFRGSKLPDSIHFKGGFLHQSANLKYKTAFLDVKKIHGLPKDLFSYQTPVKDSSYLEKRYLLHPFRSYQVVRCEAEFSLGIVVTRVERLAEQRILRIIDYIGPISDVAGIILAALNFLFSKSVFAYVDFVCSGFEELQLRHIGFHKVDFDSESDTVPNLFEPIVYKSIQMFANADHGFENVVMVKGNGDQDRPNLLRGLL